MEGEFADEAYARAHQKAEVHLRACQDALYDEEEGDEDGDEVESPAIAPFCGCETCVIREVLYAAKEELTAIARLEAIPTLDS